MSKNPLFARIFLCLACFGVCSCGDDEAKREEEQRVKIEKERSLLSNSCQQDSDCIVTGCRNSLCRAMPEDEYCDHRIVLQLDDKKDLGVVERIVKQRLTVREAESVRLGGHSAGKWLLSFQGPQAQRERVERALETLSMSGLAVLHPNAAEDSQKIFEAFGGNDDVKLRTMRGAGALVEKLIRSGDLLSKDDIRDAWKSVAPKLNETFDLQNDIEHLWGYDVITGKMPYIRLWPVDRRSRISVKMWTKMKYRVENGDIHIEGSLSDNASDSLMQWTTQKRLVLLLLGNEILATALPNTEIEDGNFELIMRGAGGNRDLIDALDVLDAVADMKGSVRIDSEATARVERDIKCMQEHPRECGCMNNVCGWKHNPDYNQCLYDNN